jgi:hypothetical protein
VAGFNPFSSGLSILATTGPSGIPLINGTPNMLTWTSPNDGAMHRVMVFGEKLITALETGGQVNLVFTDMGGTQRTRNLATGGQAAGIFPVNFNAVTVQPNTQVIISQAALTAGASTLFAEIWGS